MSGHVAVRHGGHGHVVQAAAQVVPLDRAHPRGLAAEQIREEVEVVDGVGLGHADVRARPLEAGEAAGGVADARRCARRQRARAARRSPDGSERCGRPARRGRPPPRPRRAPGLGRPTRSSGFSTKQCRPAARHRLGDGPMAVGRRHDVHRVDGGQRGAIVGDHARSARPPGPPPTPPRRRHVGHPDGGAELAEHAQMLLAPAAEADQQDVHRRSSRGSDRRPRPRRPRSGAGDASSSGRPAGRRWRRTRDSATPYFDWPKRRGRWLHRHLDHAVAAHLAGAWG